jgi:hypothetical protein
MYFALCALKKPEIQVRFNSDENGPHSQDENHDYFANNIFAASISFAAVKPCFA